LLAVWLAALGSLPGCGDDTPPAPAPRPPGPPNVLLVTLDTTRAGHLGAYRYDRDTSPNLDRLALEGRVYERAYSTCSWTLPAHASLFTGRFPSSHGATHDPAGSLILAEEVPDQSPALRANPLDASLTTLAERLTAAGYRTGAVVAGPWLLRVFGLGRGFEHYDDAGADSSAGRRAQDVSDAALAWIERHAAEPFFLFLNYFDPHSPYQDPDGLDRMFEPRPGVPQAAGAERLPERYDGEIRYMDLHLGRVLDRLRELELYDVSWIVVTGDHGEMLGEHDLHGHGAGLWEQELRVPLIVKPPADRADPGRSRQPVQIVDVMPLILDQLGLEIPDQVQGRATPGT
jgi:arylsulfatase A-like enzyme